jgi:hypothetical protein
MLTFPTFLLLGIRHISLAEDETSGAGYWWPSVVILRGREADIDMWFCVGDPYVQL